MYPYGYNLEWVVPLNGGFPLLGYRILVWVVTPGQANHSSQYLVRHPELLTGAVLVKIYEPVLSNPYDSVFRLDDLEAETIYKVSIEAHNAIGYSNKTFHYFSTPIGDALGKPPRVRGSQNRLMPLAGQCVTVAFLCLFLFCF